MKRKTAARWMLMGFLLGIYRGRVALWQGQDPEPARVFPYYASALPPQARQALEKGIYLEDLEDLEALMEKYLP